MKKISTWWEKLFIAGEAINKAARAGNIEKVNRLIKAGVKPDTYYVGCTPLQRSLLSNNSGCPSCALLLLQHGADPNAFYKFNKFNNEPEEKTIQPYITGGHLSTIRLLTIYGATSEGVSFDFRRPESKQVFSETRQLYLDKILFEEKIATLPDGNLDKQLAYLKLAEIWQQVSDKETHPVYKRHYQQQADKYYQCANFERSKCVSLDLPQAEQVSTEKHGSLWHRRAMVREEETQTLLPTTKLSN